MVLIEYGLVEGEEIKEEAGLRYHFRVTWPFCTRFMLNPTVGIELDLNLVSRSLSRLINAGEV